MLAGRHACVSHAHPDQMATVADICSSWIMDNGSFSAWVGGTPVTNWAPFYSWVDEWRRHPGAEFALIPDVIDGQECDNDALIEEWPFGLFGVPVWHLHESLGRLVSLVYSWPTVALGSSGAYSTPGTESWWARMAEAMEVATDSQGRPHCKLHLLRGLDASIFTKLPLASADSTNLARNIKIDKKWKGTYQPPSQAVRAYVLASRIEAHNSAPRWAGRDANYQEVFNLEGGDLQ